MVLSLRMDQPVMDTPSTDKTAQSKEALAAWDLPRFSILRQFSLAS
jgi:hypothetical protein